MKSTDPTLDPDELKEIFAMLHPELAADGVDTFYEHQQWWVYSVGHDRHFSVVDAVGSPKHVCDGLSFEEIF
jgi:hypothetical protein